MDFYLVIFSKELAMKTKQLSQASQKVSHHSMTGELGNEEQVRIYPYIIWACEMMNHLESATAVVMSFQIY